MDIKPRVLETRKISEKQYRETILRDLQKYYPGTNEVALVMLQEKMGNFDGPIQPEKGKSCSPLFVYDSTEYQEALETIKPWIDFIDSKHFFLPELLVFYFICILNKGQFEAIVEDVTLITDENLRRAINKYNAVA